MYFPNYGLRKMWLDNCLKSPVSEDPSTKYMANRPKHFWNLNESSYFIFIDHCERNWEGGKSLLVIWKILRLVVNTFTADEEYSVLNKNNSRQPIHMQLSQKRKTFSWIFFAYLKSVIHLEHFQNKMTLIADVFPKLRTPKNVVK